MQLMATPESRALRHIFNAERAASKVSDIPEDTQLRDVKKVGMKSKDSFDAATMKQVVLAGLAAGAEPARVAAVKARAAHFDWDRCAAQYLALYRRLLGIATG